MLERTAEPGSDQAGGGGGDTKEDTPSRAYLHFVDLAGCERVKRTGNSGARLKCVGCVVGAGKGVFLCVKGRGGWVGRGVQDAGGVLVGAGCRSACRCAVNASPFDIITTAMTSLWFCMPLLPTLPPAPHPLTSLPLLLPIPQGERGHQLLPDDVGALPGGAALQPAAPGGPAGHPLQGEQGVCGGAGGAVRGGGAGHIVSSAHILHKSTWPCPWLHAFYHLQGKLQGLRQPRHMHLLLLSLPLPHPLAPARWPSPQITYLFKDVLHGLGRFVLVVNVSPDAAEFNETKRVLQVGVNGCSLHRVG